MSSAFWLWYPGDFELYHALRQNFSRVERGYGWPAFWKSEGFRNRVVFRRRYTLAQDTSFTVYSKAVGYVLVGERKYPFCRPISCPAGDVSISIHAGCIETFPSVYVEGAVIRSDAGWMAEDYSNPAVPAGHSKYFTCREQDPSRWDYAEKQYLPIHVEQCQGGTLYEFETELTAVLWIQDPGTRSLDDITVYCGESREEALDRQHCYYSWKPEPDTGRCPRCAVRFAFIPGPPVQLAAIHQYVDIPVRASFRCDDAVLNRIWAVAEHTFRLCSGIFFIDGIKRDKWIWCADAYQSFYVNRFLMADPDIDRRTLFALRGNDPMTTHINTILDYSLFWVLGLKEHYEAYGDLDFLRLVWPKAQSLMDFCRQNTDKHGFLAAREQDWTFIDWADLDKEGPVAAIQMLLAGCWQAMAELAEDLGEDSTDYREKHSELLRNINVCYWDIGQGAFVDGFVSGKRHVSRQSNIFAVLYGVANAEQRRSILENVIANQAVPPITTPYFNFYELDMLASNGALDTVMQTLHSYWGGMLERGAVTFWEEFDPTVIGPAQYDMYGDKFGKSLCHAWSASPIYLLSRYYVGLRQSSPEGGFVLAPHLEYFHDLDCTLPLGAGDGFVRLHWDSSVLEIETNRQGGVLRLGKDQYPLTSNTLRITPGAI